MSFLVIQVTNCLIEFCTVQCCFGLISENLLYFLLYKVYYMVSESRFVLRDYYPWSLHVSLAPCRLLRHQGSDGTYLIREGRRAGAEKVLSVWHIDRCRHYKLFKDDVSTIISNIVQKVNLLAYSNLLVWLIWVTLNFILVYIVWSISILYTL